MTPRERSILTLLAVMVLVSWAGLIAFAVAAP